ncbi:MAG: glycoside hydrolase family 9 protein [Acidobacteria bacterium]|nr:glycoside hydrolase family 9 protein [Acidobacteriota bacterium]
MQDNRRTSPQPWFSIQAPLEPGSRDTEVRVEITPSIQTNWRKPPVIGVSQAGYLPNQPKRVVLELDPRDDASGEVRIHRLTLDGAPQVAAFGPAKPWGRFLRQQYAVFDFSQVREPGVYVAEFRGQSAGPFRIAPDVYTTAWQPAITYFLPVQMCHVAVREGGRTWHGACHLDDALQAPAGRRHIDSYVQSERREGRFADYERIPGLDYGGWHDAGDLDLPGGSFASTTTALALAQEEFRPPVDDCTYRRAERLVELHVPDGRSDLLQQIEFGAESLLVSFRAAGYVFAGIIENSSRQYGHLGDPVNVSDNKPCPAPGPACDDRWVFTNRNTGLQYQAVQTLAIAHRVLKDFNPAIAAECLDTARKLWDSEQPRTPVYAPSAYAPRDSGFRTQEIGATAELFLTTGEARYRARLLELVPQIRKMPLQGFGAGPGWTLARALDKVNDADLRAAVLARAKEFAAMQSQLAAANPYGVPFPKETASFEGSHSVYVWGPGWNFQNAAMHNYFYRKHLPDLFTPALTLAVVDYFLGVHPASNESYISGVGARSPLAAYGINRADWSHIPGGNMAGASLIRPDFFEMKRFPFLWYQTEYVIHGSATYLFDLLAAEKLTAAR